MFPMKRVILPAITVLFLCTVLIARGKGEAPETTLATTDPSQDPIKIGVSLPYPDGVAVPSAIAFIAKPIQKILTGTLYSA